MINRSNAIIEEQTRKGIFDNLAIGQHIRNTTRYTQVIFQHHKASITHTYQIRSNDRGIDVAWHAYALHLTAKMAAGIDHFAGQGTVVENVLFVIDVLQKHIQRGNALNQALFDLVPLGAGNDPWQQIVGKDAFGSFLFTIDVNVIP
jgi:hypothetical protein